MVIVRCRTCRRRALYTQARLKEIDSYNRDRGTYQCRPCPARAPRPCVQCGNESYHRRKTGLCQDCRLNRHWVVCALESCDITVYRPPSTMRSGLVFCSKKHEGEYRRGRTTPTATAPYKGRLQKRRTPSGRRKQRIERLRDQPSYKKIAADAGLSVSPVINVLHYKRPCRPLSRRRLERAERLPVDEGRSEIVTLILDRCIDNDYHILNLEDEAGIKRGVLYQAVERNGGLSAPTLAQLAPVIGQSIGELERLCPQVDRGWGHYAASLVNIMRYNASRKLTISDVDGLVDGVLSRYPDLRRKTVEARMRELAAVRAPQPGRPATFTHAQTVEVRRLRDAEGLSWPEIGRRMGWPVKKWGCPKAQRAYASVPS